MEQQMEVKRLTMQASKPPSSEEYAALCVDGWRIAHIVPWTDYHPSPTGGTEVHQSLIIYLERAGLIVDGRPN